MKRNAFKSLRAGVVAILFAVSAAHAERPDVVIFLADDYSHFDASPYGARDLRTPNMQRLAEDGLTFDQAFVASPSCAPSRAALLTGLMPARNGAEPNHSRPRAEIRKWPAWFQELGYEVVAFGKVAHYEHTKDYGFDHYAHDKFHEHAAIPAAVRYLKERDASSTRPLCLMVGSNWPHVPWPKGFEGYDPEEVRLPAGSVETTETRAWRAQYAAAVTRADNDLGQIYDAARDAFGDKMLFLFSSDHGSQWPFGKWNCYDAGIRVPLIVSWPGVVKPSTRTEAMVSWVDFLPTILEAVGGTAPSDIDGQSFLSVLRDPRAGHRDRIFTTHSGDGRWNVYPIRSLRTRGWKYILNLHPEFAYTTHIDLTGNRAERAFWTSWEEAAKTNDFAAAVVDRYHRRPKEELYDLQEDPDEQRNLAQEPEHAEKLQEMRKELRAWILEQGDQEKVYDEPRLLSDRRSYGPGASNEAPAPKPRKH